MFEEYPFAKSSYRYLLDFLALLTPERHKEIAEMLFPKYMLIDGKDFIFNKNITRRKYTWYSNEVYGVYGFSNESNSTKDIFKETIGNGIPHHIVGLEFVELLEYINTLSSSDVEKIKRLVDSDGTIYPLVEIYIVETQYVQYSIAQQQYRDIGYTPTISEAIVVYIRENPTKEINYNWFHPDISYFSWSETYRHYLHLSIMDLCDEKVGMLNNRECDTIYNITKEHCLSKMNPDEIAFMTSVATVCNSHIPHSPQYRYSWGYLTN